MSERKFRVVGSGSVRYESGIGPRQTYHNHENYPVEVTVRRVTEKVDLGLWRVGYFSDKTLDEWGRIQRILNAAGYTTGDSVRVIIEPLP